jgi:hypothetical protein
MSPAKNKNYELIWQYSPSEVEDHIELAFELLLKPIFDNPNKFQDGQIHPKADSTQKCE